MGSYNGPVTFLVEVSDGHLTWLDAKDHATGKSERITLMRSLKSAWQFVPASQGGGQDILQAVCRPTPAAVRSDAVRFVTTYRRYFFDGQSWIRLARAVDGLTEFDAAFPARTSRCRPRYQETKIRAASRRSRCADCHRASRVRR